MVEARRSRSRAHVDGEARRRARGHERTAFRIRQDSRAARVAPRAAARLVVGDAARRRRDRRRPTSTACSKVGRASRGRRSSGPASSIRTCSSASRRSQRRRADVEKHTSAVRSRRRDSADGLMRTDMLFPIDDVQARARPPVTREIVAYLGPKNYDDLEHADDVGRVHDRLQATIDRPRLVRVHRPAAVVAAR